jgi:uncharacterized protein (TIGR02145 family)
VGTAYGNQLTFTTTLVFTTGISIAKSKIHKWFCSGGHESGYGALYNAQTLVIPKDYYGALYNWYAANNAKNIANTGWHLSTFTNVQELVWYCNPALNGMDIIGNTAAPKLRETGFIYWRSPNTGSTNITGFNARGSGSRQDSNGLFSGVRGSMDLWSNSGGSYVSWAIDYNLSELQAYSTGGQERRGRSVRLVKDSTLLSDGQTGTYTGNDGQVYNTICIGTREWISENLKETKYRDGTSIPIITDNTSWTSDNVGAMCYPNNDRRLMPSGWHVLNFSDFRNLQGVIVDDVYGYKLQSIGTQYWSVNSSGTNQYGFNYRGVGFRRIDGIFTDLKISGVLWIDYIYQGNRASLHLSEDPARLSEGDPNDLQNHGLSIRGVKDSTVLTNGQTGTVTDIDGNIYITICIGGREYMAENLKVTKYSDGTSIPQVTDNATWTALTTDAMCYYNNDPTYA